MADDKSADHKATLNLPSTAFPMKADPALSRIPVIVSTANPDRAPPGAVVLPKPLHLPRLLEC